ncbi:MAG: hypothetical protein MJZ72_02785 [Bacteroidales bacterium]|nr:hypothetical protein [Bacteroidales bacterium]
MKRILIIIILTMGLQLSFAQNIGEINIGVVVPEQTNELDASQMSKIKTKLERICTQNGIETGVSPQGFVLYPIIELYETEVIEGGMQSLYSVKIEFSLFVKQLNGATVGSISKKYKGAGDTKEKAIVNAIANISTSDTIFKSFMANSKQNILNYYQTYCKQIISDAQMLAKQEYYEESLAILLSIPTVVPCYNNVLEVVDDIYSSYQAQQCNNLLQKARASYSVQKYYEAAEYLGNINPPMFCYEEAQKLLTDIQNKFSEKEKRDWDFKMQQHNDEISLQKRSIDAAKEVAKAYCSQKINVNYQQIIK